MIGKRLLGSKSKPGPLLSGPTSKTKKLASPLSSDNAVFIPCIKSLDNLKTLPKYAAALARPKDEYLPAEDLDAVQIELEVLLSTAAQRFRILKTEYDTIEKEDRRDRKSKFVEKPPSSPGKRKRLEEKKIKDRTFPSLKISKNRHLSGNSPALLLPTDESYDVLSHAPNTFNKDNCRNSVVKNDIPNKFWLSVEPFCMPLTNEDLKLLEDLLLQNTGSLIPPIPELGQHYSRFWTSNDIKEERPIPKTGQFVQNNEFNTTVNKGHKLMGENATGPFTQRLVSILMEENFTENGGTPESSGISEHVVKSQSLAMMQNGISIEGQLRKELIEQGIINALEIESQKDGVLAEIKRVTAELLATAEFNNASIKKLLIVAQDELARLDKKWQLDALDQEIIESYKKVLTAKQKRKQLTIQEREEVHRLAEEQRRVSDELEIVKIPGSKIFE